MSYEEYTDIDRQSFIDNDVADLLKANICTDYIHLTSDCESSLIDIWKSGAKELEVNGEKGVYCPSDLLFQETIPLTDVTFVSNRPIVNEVIQYRVLIYPNYHDAIEWTRVMNNGSVGLIEIYFAKNDIRYVFGISFSSEHPNIIYPIYLGCIGSLFVTQKTHDDKKALLNLSSLAYNNLGYWYAVQLCLLNPVTKVIFSKPTMVKLHGKEKVEAQRKDKTIKYVKHYYVREEEVDEILYGGDRSFNRKCLIWYVTGHWREYSNGHRTFIKGYFKGALRNTPSEDVVRKRELVLKESEVANE